MVEITYLAIVGIAMAAMFFGYGFGLFEGRNQGYKRRKAEEVQEKKDQPPAPPVTVAVDDPGLLRIKNENGLLAVDLDGQRVDTSSLSPQQRKRLIEMLNVMRPWLEGKPAPPPAAPEETQLPPVAGQPRPGPQPTPAAASSFAKEDRPAPPANSIVAQVDAILQARLAGSPLESRGVFLA
ncbi:MAG TPA: hypothetical protein VI524_13745, partial [Anaerolineales bacterium]|nr:hypothetical protein [Anaerolineales bacterium]